MELTERQIEKGKKILAERKTYVDTLLKEAIMEIPPTEVEDKNNPFLWKPNHWKWFLKTYI